MNYGVVYPQTEMGKDPIAIRDYAQTAEELGFSHILAYEHVLGANPNRPGGLQGIYTHQDAFFEPFVLFSFLAGQTRKIRIRNRYPGLASKANRSGSQASCLPGYSQRGAVAAGDWRWVERCRVYCTQPGVSQPRAANRGTGRSAAFALEPSVGEFRGEVA